MIRDTGTCRRGVLTVALSLVWALVPLSGSAWAQIKSPAERLTELEERVRELEGQLDAVALTEVDSAKEAGRAQSLLTLLGERFSLGGKAEFQLIDSESERDPVVGTTDNAEPRLAIDILRLSPQLDFNREVRMRGQIDFLPDRGRTRLKELTLRHRVRPLDWLQSDVQLGLDDRFIRMGRDTENYPLVGNAFWRDESIALTYRLRIGDRNAGGSEEEPPGALDFGANPGELGLYCSVGNGYTLDNNEAGFDRAGFNDLIHDNREVGGANSLREVGVGLGYRRNFQSLGEAELLGFYYDDELTRNSMSYLQNTLTVRDNLGNSIAGYGDSASSRSSRYGVNAAYFLPASVLYGAVIDTRRRDGLTLQGQWIQGDDGQLRRDGWFVQASFRFSFPEALLFRRYLRSIEPIVRYGELNTNINPDPRLPGTWDREEFLIGAIVGVTQNVLLKVEYTLHDEETGAGAVLPGPSDVANDELSVLLQVRF